MDPAAFVARSLSSSRSSRGYGEPTIQHEQCHVHPVRSTAVAPTNTACTRSSSTAYEKSEVLAISKEAFEKMLHETNSHIRVDSSTGARILAFINMVCPISLRKVRRNEILFKQGDTTPACLYIVNTGSLDVFEKDRYRKDVKVETLHEGECFGYISLLNSDLHAQKSYTIKCSVAQSELLVIDGEDFHRLMDHSRVVSSLMENLTRKRRDHAQEAMFHARVSRFKGW